jgi:hypothetical protein
MRSAQTPCGCPGYYEKIYLILLREVALFDDFSIASKYEQIVNEM